jgi:hypothetical protein
MPVAATENQEKQARRRRPLVPVVPPPAPGVPNIAHVGLTLAVIDSFTRRVAADNAGWVRAFGAAHLPQAQAADLAADEAAREVAFAANTRRRAQEGLTRALKVEDPAKRKLAIRGVLARERHYAVLRSEAVATRARALQNYTSVQAESPEGAVWMLNPLVRQHTADCLALAGRFWPWTVLADIRPPRHAGCRCYLLGGPDARRRGLWNGLVPTDEEARAMLAQIMPDDDEH